MSIDLAKLAEPFPPWDLEWRVGQVSKRGTSATLLAYITSRAVMDRLDEVVGPANWRDQYTQGPLGGVLCGLSIRIGDEWVTKWDGADNSKIEAIKGGLSGALKRAAVKWGIGRYLYKLETRYHPIRQGWAERGGVNVTGQGRNPGHVQIPQLPNWAMPKPGEHAPADDEARRAAHDPEWENGGRERFFAQLAEIDYPVHYKTLCLWLGSINRPRPSHMTEEQRKALVDALGNGFGDRYRTFAAQHTEAA